MAAVAATSVRSVNPATLEVVGEVSAASPDDVAVAVEEAAAVQALWVRAGMDRRRRLFAALLQALLDRADEIAQTITAETGKPLVESLAAELFVAAENVRWLRRAAPRALRSQRLRPPPLIGLKRGWIVYEPLGVVAVVAPWNFPFAIPFTQAAAVVSAGNAAVVKPSELTPLTGGLVAQVFEDAGFPVGLVRVVQGAADTGHAVVEAPGVAKVVFTGSARAGRDVAAAAGALLRPATLELGGKDPMLVFADADFERAVAGALWGSFTNCGQVCAGAERIYVERPVFERFAEALGRRARALRIGRGDDPATDLGPLVTERDRERVEDLVADALVNGADVAAGGGRPDTGLPGWFHEPTVLAGERIEGRIGEEEVFGPLVTVEPFGSEADAIARANGSSFGLGASVWTRDVARARRVGAALEAGAVWHNDIAYSYYFAQAPWGGRKQSGYGRTHGVQGLRSLVHVKYVDTDAGRGAVPWWYPYRQEGLDGLRGALDMLYRRGVAGRGVGALRRRAGIAHLVRRAVGRP